MKVAFIGLGVMGYPMAGHLAKAGHEVSVYNRTQTKAEQWLAEYGADKNGFGKTPADVARNADVVMTCVGNDNDLLEVVMGPDGAATTMKAGSVLVDHTTASARIARELHAQLAEKGIGFIDAPVSGGQQGAINCAFRRT